MNKKKDMQSVNQKIRYRVCNADRTSCITIFEEPSLEAVLNKAKRINSAGTRLFLQEENSMIGDDESLKYYTQLMVLSDFEIWTSPQPESDTPNLDNTVYQVQHHDMKVIENVVVEGNGNSMQQYDTDDYQLVDPNDTVEAESPSTSTTSSVEIKAAFEKFTLPWEKLPTPIIDSLQNRQYLQKNDMQVVARLFVTELKAVSTEIPKDVIKTVAKQASNKYPKSFLEMDGGVFLTSEPYTLVEKMVNIYHYSRRSPHAKSHTLQELNVSLAALRKRKRFEDSVVNYQPNIIDAEPQMVIKKQWLQKMINAIEESENLDTVRLYMSTTYGLQRKEINAKPIFSTLIADWPYLLRSEYFNAHFQFLTGKNLEDFSKNFDCLREIIIKVTSAKQSKAVKELLPVIRHKSAELKCLKLICAHFNENSSLIIKEFELGATLSTVESAMKNESVAETPMIAIIDSPQCTLFYIFIDREFRDEQPSLTLALQKLFGFYFIFNISYPTKLTNTMEFMQRLLLSIIPDEVRGKKPKSNVINNVNKLMLSVMLAKKDEI